MVLDDVAVAARRATVANAAMLRWQEAIELMDWCSLADDVDFDAPGQSFQGHSNSRRNFYLIVFYEIF